jgi:hypothetical protein
MRPWLVLGIVEGVFVRVTVRFRNAVSEKFGE